MFINNFEKTAANFAIARGLGALKGTLSRGTRAIKSGIKGYVRGAGEAASEASRAALHGKSVAAGENLAKRRITQEAAKSGSRPTQEAAQAITHKSHEDVLSRASRMNDSKIKNKPSFAQKHPYFTAGGAFLAGRYALGGGGQNQQQQQPQVIYPQQ